MQKGGATPHAITGVLPITTVAAAGTINIFTTPEFNINVKNNSYLGYSMKINDRLVNAFTLVDNLYYYIVLNAAFWSNRYIFANNYITFDESLQVINVLDKANATINGKTITLTIGNIKFLESNADQDSKDLVTQLKSWETGTNAVSETKNTLMEEGFFALGERCTIM
jgi:hypothetical protein